jgi:hypothetical protein
VALTPCNVCARGSQKAGLPANYPRLRSEFPPRPGSTTQQR